MKHFSCAGLWSVRARATSLPGATVTVGCSTTLFELADAVSPYLQRALSTIGIGCHDDASFGGEVEIPELVAS